MTERTPLSLTIARRVHRGLLRLAPRDTQRRYHAEVRETFEAMSAEAHARGGLALLALLARELADVFASHRHRPAQKHAMANRLTFLQLFAQITPQFAQTWRSLIRRPGYSITVLVTIALGTGVTTTLFSVVDTVLLKPLPYPAGDRLVTVFEASPTSPGRPSLVAPGRLEDWQRATSTFETIAGSYGESVTDTTPADPERLDGRRVTPRFFDVFAAPPLYGRTFSHEEEQSGGPRAVVISEPFWSRRFARSPSAIGQSLTIGGIAHTIVGVMDRTFAAATVDIWLPAQVPPSLMRVREARFVSGIGRLKPGVTIEQAIADLASVQATLGEQFPDSDRGWSVLLTDLRESRVGNRRTSLLLVFGAVGVVWLVSIANVAGLVLVQTQRRTRELSIRAALGATRGRVIGHVIQETAVLAAAGGVVGLLFARGVLRLVPVAVETLPRLNELVLDWRGAAFALGTCMLTTLVCAAWPAWQSSKGWTVAHQSGGSRGSTRTTHRSQRALVGLQVALGVVLCSSAAFLASSYHALTGVETGIDADNVITFRVAARWDEDRARVGQMQQTLLERLVMTPGIEAAGITNFLPAGEGTLRAQVRVDGVDGTDGNGFVATGTRMISAGYPEAVRLPIITGSGCTSFTFDFNKPGAVLVNRAFIDRYAGGQSLVGRTLRIESIPGVTYAINGVVGNVAEDGLRAERAPFIYTCDSAGSWPDPYYVVRATDTAAVIPQIREVVRSVDGSRAVFGLRTLDTHLDDSIAEPRLTAGAVSIFALSALLLGALGLYALFARIVLDSRREIGVRLALGATRAQVVHRIASDAGRLLMGGLAVGVTLSVSTHRLLQSWLPEATASDATALVIAAAVLTVVCSVAILLPATRAAGIAPTEALRTEG